MNSRWTFPLLCAVLCAPVYAQQSAQPAADQPKEGWGKPAEAEARDALKRKEGDVDQQSLLKETLTAADKQYSLIKRGKYQVTYDLNYTYTGQQKINANFGSSGLTLFNIENDAQHTVTNTVAADYGVLDNLTGTLSVPLVTKYANTPSFSGVANSVGDISAGLRWQPFGLSRDWPTLTMTGNLRMPTGRSPFKTIVGQGLSTGNGVWSATGGINVSKILDPVAIFGSLNLTLSKPATGLNQARDGSTLTRVAPGPTLGFGMGFAYALSYTVSTTMSVQEQVSARTKLRLLDGTGQPSDLSTEMQTAAVMNFGLGWRVSPQTTVNVSVGIGLTADSPNLSMSMNVPLHF